jgi:hypothetical protein
MRYEYPGVEERKQMNILRTIYQPVEKVTAGVTGMWAGRKRVGNGKLPWFRKSSKPRRV